MEPEFGAQLSAVERELAGRLTVPVVTPPHRQLDLPALLAEHDAFAAVLVDGMLLHRVAIGGQPGMRLLGPGDMLGRSAGPISGLVSGSAYRASGPLRLALLDDRVLLAGTRFPRLFAGLQTRLGDQHERLMAQLVICQLPRVQDRVLAVMWLLAETWGRVTASGTVLPLVLTHDAIGELIGARRSTVTLALKELAERGALFRQDGEWLLHEPPPAGEDLRPLRAEPEVVTPGPTR